LSEVTAQLNNLRMAPRKVRAVVNLIKNKNVLDALAQLEALVKRSGSPVAKLLRSAIANAENNNDMVKENLYVKSINVDEGVKLKRFKPKGFGRVSPLEKKTSRIRVVLAEKVAGMKRSVAERPAADFVWPKANSVEPTAEVEPRRVERPSQETKRPFGATSAGGEARQGRQGKPEIKTELGKKEGVFGNIGKKIFRRKVI